MTREEQIVKRAEEVTSRFSYRNGYSTAKDAFIEGAKWADNNQPSPWVSVLEDLPPLIGSRGVSKAVLVKVRDNMTGSIRTAIDYRFADDSLFRWKSEGLHTEGIFTVTHWMPIPELKQQDIASEVISYQQEEEEIKRLIDEYSEKFPQGGIGGPLQINTGEMILSKEECEKIRTAVLENKPEVVEEIVVDHAIEFLSKKIQQ